MLSYYPEEMLNLRAGQTETCYIVEGVEWGEPTAGPHHLMIKTFFQTDEEAAGNREKRRAMVSVLEGSSYEYNGKKGVYQNVGDCELAPREYALSTMLILSPTECVWYGGDWDYKEMMEKYENSRKCFPYQYIPFDNSELKIMFNCKELQQ